MHHGSPATQGSGETRYTLRIVFEISSFDQLKGLFGDTFDLRGFPANIAHHDSFYALRVTELPKPETAERFARIVEVAIMELSARKGLTMWMHPLSKVERNESVNTRVRDAFAEQVHPEWKRRADGSVTDGGIWPNQSCVLAEHERIWEYPVLWAKPVRELTAEDFQKAFITANARRNLDTALDDERLKAATKFLNLANGEPSRETGYVLFATVLEILSDGNSQTGVGKIVAQCRNANGGTYDENEGRELYRIRNKLVHKGNPRLDSRFLSWDEFSERYWRIRELAGQAVVLKLNELSK